MAAILPFDPASGAVWKEPVLHGLSPAKNASFALGGAALAMVACVYFVLGILKESKGTLEMESLRQKIQSGARTFLHTEYKWLAVWAVFLVVLISAVLRTNEHPWEGLITAGAFLLGCLLSALSGYLGMLVATESNGRTCAG